MNLPHFFVKHRNVLIKIYYITLNVMELEELRFFDIIGSLMQEATMSES
jgi:hypothetical protein